jgi:hypothetical protein
MLVILATPRRHTDQEDFSSKPAWAKSSRDPLLKKPSHTKKSGGVAQGVGPELKPQYLPPKKKCSN